jgi:hypothetical protein
MKKVRATPSRVVVEDMRAEYTREDFETLVRGKYAARLKASSNVVVLRPEVASAFPNADAVNEALMGLINLAKAATQPARRSAAKPKVQASR